MSTPLTPIECSHILAQGGADAPVVHLGAHGLRTDLVAQIHRALEEEEVVQVRTAGGEPGTASWRESLADQVDAQVAESAEGSVLLYRRHPDPDRRKIIVPEGLSSEEVSSLVDVLREAVQDDNSTFLGTGLRLWFATAMVTAPKGMRNLRSSGFFFGRPLVVKLYHLWVCAVLVGGLVLTPLARIAPLLGLDPHLPVELLEGPLHVGYVQDLLHVVMGVGAAMVVARWYPGLVALGFAMLAKIALSSFAVVYLGFHGTTAWGWLASVDLGTYAIQIWVLCLALLLGAYEEGVQEQWSPYAISTVLKLMAVSTFATGFFCIVVLFAEEAWRMA